MNKWITHGRIIPIGLSLLLSGCIFIPWESLDDEWQLVRQEYANNSGSDVALVFTYFKVSVLEETSSGVLDYSLRDTVLHDTLSLIVSLPYTEALVNVVFSFKCISTFRLGTVTPLCLRNVAGGLLPKDSCGLMLL